MEYKYGSPIIKAIILIAILAGIPLCNLNARVVKEDFKYFNMPGSFTTVKSIGEVPAEVPLVEMDKDKDKDSSNYRTVYGFVETGVLEAAAYGIGYQINKTFSVALKMSYCWTGHVEFLPSISYGPGIILSLHNKFLFFNVINIEYSFFSASNLLENISTTFPVGGDACVNIGRENIYAKGVNFFWAVGVNFNYLKNWSPDTYAPCVKLGLNINI